jgi:hypothetical protein
MCQRLPCQRKTYPLGCLPLICLLSLSGPGCGSSAPPVIPGPDEAQAHAHDHSLSGPHGGHLLELGDEAYHIEWLHDDEGLLTLYVLDGSMEQEVPIAASKITIQRTIGDDTKSCELVAVGAESGRTARFEATDKSLIEALKLAGQGVTAQLSVEIDGQPFVAEFEHDAH